MDINWRITNLTGQQLRIEGKDGLKIELNFHYVLLFRNSKMDNKLAGCMISALMG